MHELPTKHSNCNRRGFQGLYSTLYDNGAPSNNNTKSPTTKTEKNESPAKIASKCAQTWNSIYAMMQEYNSGTSAVNEQFFFCLFVTTSGYFAGNFQVGKSQFS